MFLSLVAGALAAARPAAALPVAPRLRRLHLYNAHTGESFSGAYRDDKGPIPHAMDELCVFLRDFHSGAKADIDVGVIDFLAAILDAVGERRATVLSAYRTPATNAMLARTTFGVAEHSQHIYGRALDIWLPARLTEAMISARALRRGGVGWYPRSHFMHIDTGPVRNWTLDDKGLADLLFGGAHVNLNPPLSVSPKGQLLVRGTHRPLNVAQRLALHRRLARAERLALGH